MNIFHARAIHFTLNSGYININYVETALSDQALSSKRHVRLSRLSILYYKAMWMLYVVRIYKLFEKKIVCNLMIDLYWKIKQDIGLSDGNSLQCVTSTSSLKPQLSAHTFKILLSLLHEKCTWEFSSSGTESIRLPQSMSVNEWKTILSFQLEASAYQVST